ncbi:hypothetical protein ACLB2K_060403 [Fragaria x ananassa]
MQFGNLGSLEQHGFARNRFWSIDQDPPPHPPDSGNKAFIDLILRTSEEDLKIWPHSEVRVEGLETLDYLDNLKNRERFTEQGDAITFESEVLNDESFTILVLMALFTTFITSPIVMAIYKPARGISIRTHRKLCDLSTVDQASKDELRILACVHGPNNAPSLISFIDSIRSTKYSQLKLFLMHLVELTERSSSIVMVQRARKNGYPFFNRRPRGELYDRVNGAFQAYSQLGRVSVRPTTAISPFSTMYEDICHVAEDKRATMIVLPFHKQWRCDGEDHEKKETNLGNAWRGVTKGCFKMRRARLRCLWIVDSEILKPKLPSRIKLWPD